jgi:cell division protein FtsW (lipid II flippase)
MNLKLVPVIGIPYLFISYGGSHIITTMIMIGLSISKGNKSMNLA